ncbi:hypothetical protein DAI22_03g321100 [Oryza sativa Japonica Group]|nr:hypothetical protein DAI22_03g321100 [Oryza sativa Japonica Group]
MVCHHNLLARRTARAILHISPPSRGHGGDGGERVAAVRREGWEERREEGEEDAGRAKVGAMLGEHGHGERWIVGRPRPGPGKKPLKKPSRGGDEERVGESGGGGGDADATGSRRRDSDAELSPAAVLSPPATAPSAGHLLTDTDALESATCHRLHCSGIECGLFQVTRKQAFLCWIYLFSCWNGGQGFQVSEACRSWLQSKDRA